MTKIFYTTLLLIALAGIVAGLLMLGMTVGAGLENLWLMKT